MDNNLTGFELIPFPSGDKSNFPSKEKLEETLSAIDQSSAYKQLAELTFGEIQKFEKK